MPLKKYILLLKWALYAGYLLLLAYVVLIGGNDYRHVDLFAFGRKPNFIPFSGKIEYLTSHEKHYYKDNFNFVFEMIGNLLLLLPIPVMLILLEGITNVKKLLLLSFSISLSIETMELLLNIGEMDIDDIILNTAGAGIGIALALFIKRKYFWQRIQSIIN